MVGQHVGCIFMGPPGSGKGTQAKLLKAELSIPHISTGDILRAEVAAGSELGLKVQAIMDAGQYVSDEVMNQLVKQRFLQSDVLSGYILDGYPRTIAQAESLIEILNSRGLPIPKVFYFEVPTEVLVERISGRISCPACGAVFHKSLNPPQKENCCQHCGHVGLSSRADDDEATLRKRLEVFTTQTAPLLSFFELQEALIRLNGQLSPSDLQEALRRHLN